LNVYTSGSVIYCQTGIKTEEKNEFCIQFFNSKRNFKSRKEFCDYLKCEWFQHYAYKNDLNEGLIGEYKIVIDILGEFLDINIKIKNSTNCIALPKTPPAIEKTATSSVCENDPKIIFKFFEKSTNLFVILSIIGALISLLPSFLEVVNGKDWINQLLGTQLGFYTLTLLLTTSYTSAIFMFFILGLIARVFYHEVLENDSCLRDDKIIYSIGMVVGGIAIGSLILFLLLSWITRIDYAIRFNILIITLIIGYGVLIGFLLIVLNSFYERYPSKKLFLIGVFALIIGVVLFVLTPVLIGTFTDVSKYYEEKNFTITLKPDQIIYMNDIPPTIALSYELPAVQGNLTFFDVNYAQCHWSTNYGYFFTKNPKYSLIKTYDQEIIIPNCPYFNDQIYWTYEISDYFKHKPPVFIGFTLEDTNNQAKKLGSTSLSFNWSDINRINIENYTVLKINP
jgi:hypothetical protein